MSKIYGIILSIGVFIVGLDQWTKHIVLENFRIEGDSRPFLSWWSWTLVHNHGAAFGSFRNLPESIRGTFFILLPIVVLSLLWWSYVRHFKSEERLGPISLGLVLGGAIGNFIDRLRHGYVIDFIDWFYPNSSGSCIPLFYPLKGGGCHWPVFNIADSAISIAMVLLIIFSFKQKKEA